VSLLYEGTRENDRMLRNVVARAAFQHIEELMLHPEFEMLMPGKGTLGRDMLEEGRRGLPEEIEYGIETWKNSSRPGRVICGKDTASHGVCSGPDGRIDETSETEL